VPDAFHFHIPDEPEKQFRVVDSSDETALFVERVRESRDEVEVLGVDPEDSVSPFAFLEGSSIIVARALQAEEGDRVLDAVCGTGQYPACPCSCAIFQTLSSWRTTATRSSKLSGLQ